MAIYHLCRICLTEDTSSDTMQPLFEDSNSHCAELVRKIEECGGIALKPHEEFPKMICDQCLNSLDTSYKFRAMCQASEHALLEAIVKSELKVEPHDTSLHISNDSSKSPEPTDIFFDSEIINAEEVDLDELADRSDCDDKSIHEYDESVSDTDRTTDSEFEYRKVRGKRILKPIVQIKKVPGKRGRPRLKPISLPLENAETPNKRCKGRKKHDEAQDQIMCEICGNIYSKRSKLNMHMRRHLSEKPFECEICEKRFACPSEIRRHMRVHTGEKPYVCKFCGRSFSDRSTNIKHERIHTQERPFTCNTCGKSFTYSNVLKNHMLTHTGEKPFSCNPCNKTFSRKHQLDQHYSTLTHQHTIKNLSATTPDISEGNLLLMQSQQNISSQICIPTQ